MRNMFAQVLTELARVDNDIMLFYADIGNRLFNTLKDVSSERVINAGIAEANMTSMAAGAASLGMKPFIFTITPFTTARNFEQIKIDIAYQNLPVVIVGTGSGLSYANLGPTHHSFEDIALMRVLPNMQVICPCDSEELNVLMREIVLSNKPTYLRIGKKNEPIVYSSAANVKIGQASVLKEGKGVAILSTGTIFPLANEVCEVLESRGLSPELVSFHTVKPLDENYLTKMVEKFEKVILIEEHSKIGGFGSAVFEWMNEAAKFINITHFAIPDKFIDQVGSMESARNKAGLEINSIIQVLEEKQFFN